jgi:tripeptide aminopeptidase
LKEIGAQDVTLTDYGAVLATIPATVADQRATIALLAHVDTAPQLLTANVKPLVHRNYNGGTSSCPTIPPGVVAASNSPYLAKRSATTS